MLTIQARYLILLTIAVFFISGCSTMGHNSSFVLLYKKDLKNYYDERLQKNYDERLQKDQEQEVDIKAFLPHIYTTNLPFVLTDMWDSRGRKPIKIGEPLNIIINKIHLRNNGESDFDPSGEIAVVVTVDDGKGEEPKHVIVAYEEGIPENVDLPITSLLAYSNESYGGEPIRIEISVIDLDHKENLIYEQILKSAAAIGATFSPANVPSTSVAAKVGESLIGLNKDDIITKFTFQLYPWDRKKKRPSENFGVPRVFIGNYIIFKTDKAGDIGDPKTIQVTHAFQPYRIAFKDLSKLSVIESSNLEGKKLKQWPLPLEEEAEKNPLEETFVVFTVDNTTTVDSRKIIARADAINRAVAYMVDQKDFKSQDIDLLSGSFNSLKSAAILTMHVNQFHKRKKNVDALASFFNLYENNNLTDLDKDTVLRIIQNHLPESKIKALLGNFDGLLSWYNVNKNNLVFDEEAGTYCVNENKGKVCN